MSHVNVTIVPYLLGAEAARIPIAAELAVSEVSARNGLIRSGKTAAQGDGEVQLREGCTPIANVEFRRPSRLSGRVRSVRVQPLAGVASLEVTIADATGSINVVFFGRRRIPGIQPGAQMIVEGVVGEHTGRLALLNPFYELMAAPVHELPPTTH
jgi:hypothetical protein